MTACPTVRIKPSHPSQGAFVEINATDFDPAKHEMYAAIVADIPPPPPMAPAPPSPVDPLADLPADWRDGATAALRTLAETVSGGRTPENREQAVALIEQALAARQAQ